jgi:UDP:flavonoid glycosyltransferase YjiC (YdhE family)
VSDLEIINWAQLCPGGATGWRPDLMKVSRHRLLGIENSWLNKSFSWHKRTLKVSGLSTFIRNYELYRRSLDLECEGLLLHFPSLTAVAAMSENLKKRKRMIVAHNFNLSSLYSGVRQLLAKRAFRHVDRFIVHSRAEVSAYSNWLSLPPKKFSFVYFQQAPVEEQECQLPSEPFLYAAGSAHRDYSTLFAAVRRLRVPTVVVAGNFLINTFKEVPDCVEIRSGLSMGQCWRLLANSRVHVVPLLPTATAAGQVAIASGLRLGVPTVVTECVGSADYVQHRQNGLTVQPGDVNGLCEAIMQLWEDEAYRGEISKSAQVFANSHLTDEAAIKSLIQILEEVSIEHGY